MVEVEAVGDLADVAQRPDREHPAHDAVGELDHRGDHERGQPGDEQEAATVEERAHAVDGVERPEQPAEPGDPRHRERLAARLVLGGGARAVGLVALALGAAPPGGQGRSDHDLLDAHVGAVVHPGRRSPGVEQHEAVDGRADGQDDGHHEEAVGPTAPEDEEAQRRPDEVELLLDGQRPGVQQGRGRAEEDEVVLVGDDEAPVGDVGHGGEGVAADGGPGAGVGHHQGVERHHEQRHRQRRQQASGPAAVEGQEADGLGAGELGHQQRGDQEPREDEEDVDAQQAPADAADPGVEGEHAEHGQGPDAVEARDVAPARWRGDPRRGLAGGGCVVGGGRHHVHGTVTTSSSHDTGSLARAEGTLGAPTCGARLLPEVHGAPREGPLGLSTVEPAPSDATLRDEPGSPEEESPEAPAGQLAPPGPPDQVEEQISQRAWWWWLGGITLVGLAVRLGSVLGRPNRTPGGDGAYYFNAARLFIEGKGWINPFIYAEPGHHIVQTASWPPLFVLVMAVPQALGIHSYLAARIWLCLFSSGAMVLVAYAGKEINGKRLGLIAAAIVAIYPNIWMSVDLGLSETMTPLLVAWVLWMAYRFWRRPSARSTIWLAVALSVTMLGRDELTLLVVFLFLPLVLLAKTKPLGERLKLVGIGAIVMVLIVGPWIGYNLSRFKDPVFISSGLGVTLASANCPQTWSGFGAGYWSFAVRGGHAASTRTWTSRSRAPRTRPTPSTTSARTSPSTRRSSSTGWAGPSACSARSSRSSWTPPSRRGPITGPCWASGCTTCCSSRPSGGPGCS